MGYYENKKKAYLRIMNLLRSRDLTFTELELWLFESFGYGERILKELLSKLILKGVVTYKDGSYSWIAANVIRENSTDQT